MPKRKTPVTPWKRTPQAATAIIQALTMGATRTAAAAMGGISLATLSRWMVEDVEFADSIISAEGSAEYAMSQSLFSAGGSDWRAAESWLKRRRRSVWGDNVTVSADKEAAGIIAELFGEEAGGDTPVTPAGEG